MTVVIRLMLMVNVPRCIVSQEVLHNQLLDILSLLGPGWACVGVGRDDGQKAGEYSPIFYNTSVQMLICNSHVDMLTTSIMLSCFPRFLLAGDVL
jgi:hypothetical protein